MKHARSIKHIHHRVILDAVPKRVFEALMDSTKHAEFTGEPASVDPKPGGSFTCYGTYIGGVTLELVRFKRVVQAWRSRNWPPGFYSIVTFELRPKAKRRTELRFSQVGVPARDWAAKNKGWRSHYWEPLNRYLRQDGAVSPGRNSI